MTAPLVMLLVVAWAMSLRAAYLFGKGSAS